MITLSDASKDARKLFKVSAVALICLIVGLIVLNFLIIAKNIIFPAPPPKPTLQFGKLPRQTFPINAVSNNFTYSINTVSGSLPQLPTIINVYSIQKNTPNLLSFKRFQDKVSNLGFPNKYTAISDQVFEWTQTSGTLVKALRGNVISGDFKIVSSYQTNTDLFKTSSANKGDATYAIMDLFTHMGLISQDIDTTKTKTQLLTFTNGAITPASSISTTNAVRVDLFQNDIDEIPIFYKSPTDSNLSGLVIGNQIVTANFTYHVPTKLYSSYPLKTTAQAYEDLKQNKGYIASYNGNSNNIFISNVILAYYMSSDSQDFLMPVFVFTGNDNFYAYIPAITDEWISM